MKRDVQRRLSERIGVAAAARIVGDGSRVVDCKVLDLSANGARLEIPWKSRLPNQFTLSVPKHGIERQAEVVWGSGDEVGVHFLFDETDAIEPSVPSLPVVPQPISPVSRPADVPVSRPIGDVRPQPEYSRFRGASLGTPNRSGSIFGRQVFFFALATLGVFGAVAFVRSRADPGAPTQRLSRAEDAGGEAGELGSGRVVSSPDQLGHVNADFNAIRGLGSAFLGRLAHTGSGGHDATERPVSSDDLAAIRLPVYVPQPVKGPRPIAADSLGPAAFPQPAIPALQSARAHDGPPAFSEASTFSSSAVGKPSPSVSSWFGTTAILTFRDLAAAELEPVKECLDATARRELVAAGESLPHFVFADACLRKRISSAQKLPNK